MKTALIVLLSLLWAYPNTLAKWDIKGGVVKTANFIVDAPSPELAEEIATEAEALRKKIAIRWIGREIPQWVLPCLIFVSIEDKYWGWTYHYKGEIRGIIVHGDHESIIRSTLPHEITHAVVLSHYGEMPRCFDEGIAMSSEKDCPERLNGKCGAMPLKELFSTKDYPSDWESFYGQSYSVVAYLVYRQGRQGMMEFVRQGSEDGWERSCQKNFHIQLKELEDDWKQWHATRIQG